MKMSQVIEEPILMQVCDRLASVDNLPRVLRECPTFRVPIYEEEIYIRDSPLASGFELSKVAEVRLYRPYDGTLLEIQEGFGEMRGWVLPTAMALAAPAAKRRADIEIEKQQKKDVPKVLMELLLRLHTELALNESIN